MMVLQVEIFVQAPEVHRSPVPREPTLIKNNSMNIVMHDDFADIEYDGLIDKLAVEKISLFKDDLNEDFTRVIYIKLHNSILKVLNYI